MWYDFLDQTFGSADKQYRCVLLYSLCVPPVINNLLPRTLSLCSHLLSSHLGQHIDAVCILKCCLVLQQALAALVFGMPEDQHTWHRAAELGFSLLSCPHVQLAFLSLTQSCLNCCASSLGREATSCKGARIGNQMKTRVWW